MVVVVKIVSMAMFTTLAILCVAICTVNISLDVVVASESVLPIPIDP